MWSRNRAGLYIQDALAEFEPDYKLPTHSPPAQYRMYKQKLMVTHLVGFGGGGAGASGTSYLFDNATDYLEVPDSVDWDFGTGAFTMECWLYMSSVGVIFEQRVDHTTWWALWVEGSNDLYFSADSDSTTFGHVVTDISSDTWTHIAATRNGNVLDLWVDGTSVDDTTDADTMPTVSATLTIGHGAASGSYGGNMDELRISKGVARYTTSFTPSIVPFTSDANTVLLIHCDETIVSGTTGSGATFVDSGNTGHTVTENNQVIRDTSIFKIPEE